MKLKLRFKKALFAFFKDEILNSLKVDPNSKQIRIESRTLKFKELTADVLIRDVSQPNPVLAMPPEYAFSENIRIVKMQLAQEALEYAFVDNRSLFDDRIFPHHSIKVSLFIGIPSQE